MNAFSLHFHRIKTFKSLESDRKRAMRGGEKSREANVYKAIKMEIERGCALICDIIQGLEKGRERERESGG